MLTRVPDGAELARDEVRAPAGGDRGSAEAPSHPRRLRPSPRAVAARGRGARAGPACARAGAAPAAAPRARVAVSINATPWAIVRVDGREVGETPLAGIELEPGPHVFEARMPDGTHARADDRRRAQTARRSYSSRWQPCARRSTASATR